MRSSVVYKISDEPLVLLGSFGTHRALKTIKSPFIYIYHNPGWIRARNVWKYLRIARAIPSYGEIVFVTNEPSEAFWLKSLGLNAFCYGQNLHIRDNFYTPQQSVKMYDAVYAAQLANFKRLHLAAEVKRLFVVTYQSGKKEWDLHDYESSLAHAEYNKVFISKEEVRAVYQKSKVGLALSASEGAMWASVEYLMCGLPVVTTPSRGGRSRYLSSENSIEVAPTIDSVCRGVDELIGEARNADDIRNFTLEMIKKDRQFYLEFLEKRVKLDCLCGAAQLNSLWDGELGIEKYAVDLQDLGSL